MKSFYIENRMVHQKHGYNGLETLIQNDSINFLLV